MAGVTVEHAIGEDNYFQFAQSTKLMLSKQNSSVIAYIVAEEILSAV